jgi:hypothetical protein
MNDSKFGRRQSGTGPVAEMIADTFRVWTSKLGFAEEATPLNREHFQPPRTSSGQLRLF